MEQRVQTTLKNHKLLSVVCYFRNTGTDPLEKQLVSRERSVWRSVRTFMTEKSFQGVVLHLTEFSRSAHENNSV